MRSLLTFQYSSHSLPDPEVGCGNSSDHSIFLPSACTTWEMVNHTATKIPFMYSFSGNWCGLSPNLHIRVSVSDLYIPRIGPHISCSRIGRSIVGIYKSLTGTWMLELGLWPSNSFFLGIFVSNFSVLCLCSAPAYIGRLYLLHRGNKD